MWDWAKQNAAKWLTAAATNKPRAWGTAIQPFKGNPIGGGATKSSGSTAGLGPVVTGGDDFSMYPTPTFEEAWAEAQRLMQLFGWDADTAMAAATGGRGGGGGGYGGGRGGFGGIDTAARDAAIANLASTYASASATFDGSVDEYRKIHAQERGATQAGTDQAKAGAEQAAKAALASRAAERAALGIEDAAAVVSDTVANERKIAADNAAVNDKRMETRAQGHLDNNLKFNTDLKATVELEGKEKQKQIADYYSGQLAQIAARRGGGGGGGGYSRGGSRSSGSKGLTPNKQLDFLKDVMNDATMRNYQRYGAEFNQRAFTNTQSRFPDASMGNQLSASKYLYPQQPKKWF